jgi:hypothetical protein
MKRFKLILYLCFSLFATVPSFAQRHPNSLYLEVGGSAGFYSINYDRLIGPHLGVRIGFSYWADLIIPGISAQIFPMSLNCLIGNGSSKFELGVGMTYTIGHVNWFHRKESAAVVIPNFNIGYRYQSEDGGFLFRIGFTPLISSTQFLAWGGLSAGFSF